ncbi:MAG: hypothetical protein HW407_2021 [Bacteroidetes bacterium]|nr:hypothetical protein [Bacteroidota bacterium]
MIFPTRQNNGQVSRILLVLTVGLAVLLASPGGSWAAKKRPGVSNICGCLCKDSTGGGEFLTGIQNTAGVACEAYNNRTCSLDGGTRTGTTTNCQHDNSTGTNPPMAIVPPGGIKGTFQQTPATPGGTQKPTTGTIQRRGVEGDVPTSSEKEGK